MVVSASLFDSPSHSYFHLSSYSSSWKLFKGQPSPFRVIKRYVSVQTSRQHITGCNWKSSRCCWIKKMIQPFHI